MRIYIASFVAAKHEEIYGETVVTVNHFPALIPADTIELAREKAEIFAFNARKESEGWYGHTAAIEPLPSAFYQHFYKMLKDEDFDTSSDEGLRQFELSTALDAEFIDF